jgi:N-acetylmuramoyl-L-alanine amidase
MVPAVLRLAAVATFAPLMLAATEPGPRVAPTRPGETATVPAHASSGTLASLAGSRISGVEFVAVPDAAGVLGLKLAWSDSTRRLTLADASSKVELMAGSREVAVNGLRLFLGSPIVLRGGALYISRSDLERSLAPRLCPALLGRPLARPRIIALDPGHGGVDHGMENKALKLQEKVLTLEVALRLKSLLEARGYTVVLTRSDDRQLGPDKPTDFMRRAIIANQARADLLVSIHFNSLYPYTQTTSTETYTFTPPFQRSTRAWSPGESDDVERDVAPVNRFDPWSALLAQSMHRAVIASLKTFDRGQKTMHSAVLRGLNCPAVLVESVFLSNDAEARRAATPAYLHQIAGALADGIGAYADTLGKLQPKPAAPPAVNPSSPSR